MDQYRPNIKFIDELTDIIIAVVALTIGFALALAGGISGFAMFVNILPIAFLAILFSFPLHEYMHKVVAQRFGAIAAFRRSDIGIVITLATGFLGFLFGMPGATMIYTNNFTKREEGIVSIAGPLTNFTLFLLFFLIWLVPAVHSNATLSGAVYFILFINLWLAFFNMLPLFPLDGSKVLRWNLYAYVGFMLLIIVMLMLINLISPVTNLVYSMVIAFIFALAMSSISRNLIFK